MSGSTESLRRKIGEAKGLISSYARCCSRSWSKSKERKEINDTKTVSEKKK